MLEYIYNSKNAPSVLTTSFQRRCHMVNALHRCSYDNSTISSVNKLKTIMTALRSFSPFFHFSFFRFSFYFILFFQFMSKSRFFNLLDTNWIQTANTNCI